MYNNEIEPITKFNLKQKDYCLDCKIKLYNIN